MSENQHILKILKFSGGLGNQIFEYAVYQYLKNKYPKQHIYIYCDGDVYSQHNGCIEVDKVFDVRLPKTPLWVNYAWKLFSIYCRYANYTLWDEDTTPPIKDEGDMFMVAYHPDNRYVPNSNDWLKFRNPCLSERNRQVLSSITGSYSVFVHVRRGDYLLPKNIKRFGNICTADYYREAMKIMTGRHPEARFFIFSDDMAWTRAHVAELLPDATYVDWNKGSQSFIDMYLMTCCKGGVIANSTFSYWGARLGEKKDVVYPKKWLNSSWGAPDIFERHWIGI